jgi:UDP-glucose 4-epimerase
MKVLITGASGRLGRYVSARLREAGHEVTDFDAVPQPEQDDPAPFILGDLTSLGDCLRAISYAEAEVIVHLAALPAPREVIKAPGWSQQQRAREDETLGLGNRISDKPFQVDYLPIDEDHPLRPEDSYGLSKVFGEELLQAYGRAYGIKAVAFRLMGVEFPHAPRHLVDVTPESSPDHVGGPVVTTYQYVDARDVANACALAIDAVDALDDFEPFYLSTDTQYAEDTTDLVARLWPDLTEMAKSISGTDGVITDARARRKLGYQPEHSWRVAG